MQKILLLFTSNLFLIFLFSCNQQVKPHQPKIPLTESKSTPNKNTPSDIDPYFVPSKETMVFNGPTTITRNILQDKNGTIWLMTWSGIIRYDGTYFTNVTNQEGLREFHMFSILEEKEGDLWFGSIGAGAYHYDGNTFTNFTKKDGLPNNIILCFLEDKSGNVWIGTENGISRFDGKTFENFRTTEVSVDNDINSMVQDKNGKIWVGTRGGAFYFDGKKFQKFTNDTGLPLENIRTIIEDKKGDLWFGGNHGLIRFDGKNFTQMGKDFVGYLYEDKNGNIWISAANPKRNGEIGLYCYYKHSFAMSLDGANYTEIKSGDEMVFGIEEDKDGGIWFGSLGGGCRYDGTQFEYFRK